MTGIYWMGKFISMYGIMIAAGILAAGLVGYILTERNLLSGDYFLLLAAYTFGGGIFGAKILFLLVNYQAVQWDRIFEPEYFRLLMQGGYVFYGGVIGGFLMLLLGGKLHRLPVLRYLEAAMPCVPLAHAFGRVGCHFASCCYGIPYNGIGSIVYHAPAFAPVETPLFPVQLLEASLNGILAIILIWYVYKKGCTANSICIYAYSYGVIRFLLEFLRYDIVERGSFLMFSTSQWISIFLVLFAFFLRPFWLKRDREYSNKMNLAKKSEILLAK